jgi:hypothetical protein
VDLRSSASAINLVVVVLEGLPTLWIADIVGKFLVEKRPPVTKILPRMYMVVAVDRLLESHLARVGQIEFGQRS